MTEQANSTPTQYRIGAVSRMTGVSPDALRVWERRYAAVSPQRSAGGGRLYSSSDVARLRLMKQLVDAGDAIGEIANLELDVLEARSVEARRSTSPVLAEAEACRVLLVGDALSRAISSAGEAVTGITPVGCYPSVMEFEADTPDKEVDVLIVEQTTLHEDTAKQLTDWLIHANAAHAVVVYRFASTVALERLPASRCSALRAPVDIHSLQAHCLSLVRVASVASLPRVADGINGAHHAPPRRYDDETLSQLAALSSTVKCECPKHLAELIASLSGFERYSAECESRSPRDAALHAYLQAAASQARHTIEDALDHVIEVEDIKL